MRCDRHNGDDDDDDDNGMEIVVAILTHRGQCAGKSCDNWLRHQLAVFS